MAKDLFLHRRRFLKGLASAGTATSLGLAGISPARAMSLRLSTEGADCSTVIDVDRCTGCGACVTACRARNLARLPLPQKPIPQPRPSWIAINDWSTRRQVDNRLTPYNWIYIQTCTLPTAEGERRVFMPRRCLHCLNPQCVSLCPSGAARQSPQGAAYIEESSCLGDGPCQRACPWLIPQRQSGVGPYLKIAPRYIGYGLVFKCDYCRELLAQGQIPACVAACPTSAQSFGPRDDMVALAQEMAHQRIGEIDGL
ncbi:MAG: 4Fe-4S dicluster domain-containing protein, partial [Desulfovibrio sp.]|nr:4Fe-4S dicluster domain-containing protein [Desulfovibrio sp.]